MIARDLDILEEAAKQFLAIPNDEDGKTLAAFVLNYARQLFDENARFRARIDSFESERPTSPELEIVPEKLR